MELGIWNATAFLESFMKIKYTWTKGMDMDGLDGQ